MKVLLVHNILWSHYKAAVFQALDRLSKEQANVSVHVLQIGRNERSRADWELDATNAPIYTYSYELLFDWFVEDIPLRARATTLLSRMRRFRPDVLCLTGYYDPAQLLLLAYARLTGVRVVMQMESTAADQTRSRAKEWLKRTILKQCAGFFCFGSPQANYLMQLGVAPNRILLQKSAVDNRALEDAYKRAVTSRELAQQQQGLPRHNFIFVGRLIEPKNLPQLLVCFANALVQVPNANWGLVLLGSGPQAVELSRLARKLALDDRVFFRPATHWYRVPEWLALADVLVLPSKSEPWGLVVNEAMVCGMPVLVSDRCGCVPDLVRDGQNGYSYDPTQPQQLTNRLLDFMTGRADQAAMGQRSRELIAPYAPEAVAEEMLRGFDQLANE